MAARAPRPAYFELRRRSTVLSRIEGRRLDLVADGLALATAGPTMQDSLEALGRVTSDR